MRRQKQALNKEECIEILKKEPRGVLALIGDYNYPYAVPLSHVYVNGKIYFHSALTGHKIDAIQKSNKASYCVIDEGKLNDDGWSYTFKSIIVFGEIKTIKNKEEKIDKLTHLGDKFFPTHERTINEINRLLDKTNVFELTIKHMSGKIVEEK